MLTFNSYLIYNTPVLAGAFAADLTPPSGPTYVNLGARGLASTTNA